jgi:hypothetical protein
MPNGRGTASPALITRLRGALVSDPRTLRLVVTLAVAAGLWLFAWRLISTEPMREDGILVYRVDASEIVAYPRSDAAMDYLNGVALLSGDGWVNWRVTNRWSVYRPGGARFSVCWR